MTYLETLVSRVRTSSIFAAAVASLSPFSPTSVTWMVAGGRRSVFTCNDHFPSKVTSTLPRGNAGCEESAA
jgi:hypothetical protein